MREQITLFDFVESFVPPRELRLLFHDAVVTGGALDVKQRALELDVATGERIPEAAQTALEQLLTRQYGLHRLHLTIHDRKAEKKSGGTEVLLGKEIKGKPVSMTELNVKMGTAIVEGKVFAAECRETKRPGMWMLSFDMTDYQSSVTVRKYTEGQEALAENERYRELLGFTQRHTDFELEPANVVSYGASNWSSTLTLSKGSDCGIEVGDCVMNEAGALVGQVIEVGSTWATVRVGGYISSSGATAMVLGDFTLMQDGCVRFGYLAEGTSIFTGDTVLTSGKGGAFPAGLVVGTITDVRTEAGGQQTYGVITPACDLGELLQVFVIKDFDVVS